MSDQDPVPNPGDTVEVVIRGTLKAGSMEKTTASSTSGELHLYDGSWMMFTNVDVRVNAVEPVYVDGGVYKDATGEVYRYVVKAGNQETPGWESFGSNGYWSLAKPERPLTRIDS